MRHLASVRRISAIDDIPGADLIKVATIDGWKVVVRNEEFKVGDLCVYMEIDSFLPDGHPAWQMLVDKSSRVFEGVKGHRLRTVKLRGQLSQGFAAPVNKFFDDFVNSNQDEGQELSEFFIEGADLTDFLKIKKYEKPLPAELAGQVNGNFPSFIKKTDQERGQNLIEEIFVDNKLSKYEVTMKLDGTSFTAFYVDGEAGVCSRNWELKVNDNNEGDAFVRMYVGSGLQEVLRKYGKNIAVQGELSGPGIQGNKEAFTECKLHVFDIYDIDSGCYFDPVSRRAILKELWELGLNKEMVDHVPIVAYSAELYDTLGISDINGLLKFAKGPSLNSPIREGLVFKRVDGKFSFKVINNDWLLKHEE